MKRADIVEEARSWLGTPYHHQAALKGVGCDCIGLLRDVFSEEPRCLQKTWLVRRLAYRLQEIAYNTDTAKLEKAYEDAAKGKACRKRNRSDDVWTTGATLQTCAEILLKNGGAKSVSALTLARVLPAELS